MSKIFNWFGVVFVFTLIMSPIAWSSAPLDGLLLYFSFDSDSGGTTKDLSGGGHDGSLDNGAEIVKDIKQLGEGALQIKGGTAVMSVESFPELEEYQDNTYLFWIYFTHPASGAWDQILAKPAPGSDRSPGLWVHTGGLGIHYRYNPGNLGASKLGADGENGNFPQDEWYHVAGVEADAKLMLYVNGEEKFQTAVPAKHAQGTGQGNTGGLYVGNCPAYGGGAAKFVIDDLAVYERALEPNEIKAVMEGGLTPVDAKGKLASTWGKIKY